MWQLIYLLFCFVTGAVIGSFLNLIVDRATFNKSIVFPASHCPHCRHKLGMLDLIPILSFIFLQGKCRYCRAKMSIYYPIVEIFTGVLFVLFGFLIATKLHLSLLTDIRLEILTLYYLFIISSLTVIFFTDLKYGLIPFKVVVSSVLLSLAFYFLVPLFKFIPGEVYFLNVAPNYFLNYLFTAIGIFGLFLALFFITNKRGIGFGDVVYVFLMGFLLGFPNIIVGLYVAFLSGASIALILVLSNKKKFSGGTIPFGPFLVGGTIIALFWGQDLINQFMYYLLYH